MKKAAIAHWENRIAPVFDVVRSVTVIEVENGRVTRRWIEPVSTSRPVDLTLDLVDLGVGTLICGAISKPLREIIAAYGITVIPNLTGDLESAIKAWVKGSLKGKGAGYPGHFRSRGRRLMGIRGLYRDEFLTKTDGDDGLHGRRSK